MKKSSLYCIGTKAVGGSKRRARRRSQGSDTNISTRIFSQIGKLAQDTFHPSCFPLSYHLMENISAHQRFSTLFVGFGGKSLLQVILDFVGLPTKVRKA